MSCLESLAAQFFLLTIQYLIQRSDTFWFVTNKARAMLQLDMRKQPEKLEFVLPLLALAQPI
jgi:hypothetical protein